MSAPSSLSYPSSRVVSLLNVSDTEVSLIPTYSGGTATFSISPALPAGLTLSATTGQISGVPTARAAETTYTISATNALGNVSTTVKIWAASGFLVNDPDLGVDEDVIGDGECASLTATCGFRGAVNEVNSAAEGIYDLILFKSTVPTFTQVLATDFQLTKSISIEGASPSGTVLDFQDNSGGLRLTTDRTYAVRNLTLKRARRATGSGGAVQVTGSSVVIIEDTGFDSNTVAGNSTTAGAGAAIGLQMTAGKVPDVTVRRSTFLSNTGDSSSLGAVISPFGATNQSFALGVEDSDFRLNGSTGSNRGLIYNPKDNVLVAVKRSTFRENTIVSIYSSAVGTGGILVENCTFSANTTGNHMAVLGNAGNVNVYHSTFVDNVSSLGTAYAVAIQTSGTLNVANSVFHNNLASGVSHTCIAGAVSLGGNVVPASSGAGACGTFAGTDLAADPLVLPLADSGGYVRTVGIGSSSPAKNFGLSAYCPATDARGLTRANSVGDPCDAGAFEIQP